MFEHPRIHRSLAAGIALTLAPIASASAEPKVAPPAAPPAAQSPTIAGIAGAPAAAIPEPVKLSDDPRPTLGPGTFVATMNAAEHYREIVEAGGWVTVPNAATLLKPGQHAPAVAALRRRLAITQDLAAEAQTGDVFDDAIAAGLKRFQLRHGLEETGLVGPRTLAELNVPASARLHQIRASAARLMGSRFPFGERYVTVNIPSATVEAVQGGTVARRYVAIVGKTDRPSPVVATRITNVNWNPTWTVPVSLIRKDIIPHMRQDPGYLARMKIRVLDGHGAEIDPKTIDWQTEQAANYMLRQDPGVDNSLGEVRLDMPNKFAVYMHDTPSKKLFARNARMQSSGCVRVAGVRDLARWLLEGTPGPAGPGSAWGPAEVDAAIASGQRQDVKIAKPVPVAWVYLTAYVTPDGLVQFRDDVYGLDGPDPALGEAPAPTIDSLVTGSVPGKG